MITITIIRHIWQRSADRGDKFTPRRLGGWWNKNPKFETTSSRNLQKDCVCVTERERRERERGRGEREREGGRGERERERREIEREERDRERKER
jgi:hypothetical protein